MLVVALALGFATDAWGWWIAAALAAWVAWHAREFARFARWSRHPLARPDNVDEPWQMPVDRIYRSIAAARARSRRLLGELRGLTSITQMLPDAAVLTRPNGEIELFNDAASRLLGLEPRDRGGNLVGLVRHPSFTALVAGRIGEDLIEMPAPKDPERHLEVRRIVIDADNVLILVRDVTQLNRLLSMRQDFVANVSHELRTPLTIIIGYLETLEDASLSVDEMHALLDRVRGPARRMKALVDDLLLLTRLESSPGPSREELQPVAVEALLRLVVDEASALSAGRHEIALEAETTLLLWGMETELHSAFSNLVNNAVRYSPDGGRIDVRWRLTPEGACFEVEDRGLGIAPEHLSRITERFYRVDLANARVRGGTGLGLAIAKHVLKRHGANLQVASELGKGSRFSCIFPAQMIVPKETERELA